MAHGYPTSYAKMKVYSFRVYDRALTPIEIKLNSAADQARFFGAEEKDYVVVSSDKGDVGTPDPAYGLSEVNVGEVVCTVPGGVQTASDGKRYVASGWRLRSVSKETGEETVLSGSGTTCRYTHEEGKTDWLEWQFAPYVVTVSTVAELTAALADAQSGDVISAAAGTYQLAETLTVPSGVKLVSADGPATTTFKPAEDNPGVTALTVVGGTVAGFTIRDFQTTSTAVVYLKSSAVLSNCVVTANYRAASSDYGIVNINGATVSHCELYGNKGTGYCGPLSSNTGNCYVNYTLVVDNSGASYGGGVHMHAGSWWLNHCTIIGNSCSTMGSQIYNAGRSPNIRNCIIMNRPYHPTWYSWPDFGPHGGTAASSNPYFYNCLIPGIDTTVMKKTTSSGNLDLSDARFVFAGGRDYHLLADSPCIGAADDGGDIGCYPYDPDYKPTYATVDLKPTDDLLAALDAAADGTEIRLAPGEYVIDRFLNVTNRVRIIGVGGRDQTVIRPAGSGYRLLRQSNYYSQVAGITFLGATNTATSAQDEIYYWQNGGGGVALRFGDFHDNRVTQCRDTRGGAAMYCVGGWVNRCLIDRNSGSAAVVLCSVNNGYGYTYCTIENSLICENDNPSGAAVQTTTPIAWSSYTNESSAQGFKNCTVINNTTRYAVARGTKGSVVYNTILRNPADSTYEPWYDSAANAETATSPSSTVWRCCASTSAVGTNCTVAADLKVRSSGKLAWASPCRNAGFLYRMAKEPTATDYFGGPRVVSEPGEEPTIDIGCCQLSGFPPGLLMLVR